MEDQELIAQHRTSFRRVNDLETLYKGLFRNKFGKTPSVTYQDKHQLGLILQARPETEVRMLLEHYFKMNDTWFKKLGYTLDCFFQNLNKIVLDSAKPTQANLTPRANPKRVMVMGYCRNLSCKNRFMVEVSVPDFKGIDESLCQECGG